MNNNIASSGGIKLPVWPGPLSNVLVQPQWRPGAISAPASHVLSSSDTTKLISTYPKTAKATTHAASKKTKKWSKAVTKPRRPLSGYNIFYAEVRKNLHGSVGGVSSLTGKVADLWNQLSEKERVPYMVEAAKDYARYERELSVWEKQRPGLQPLVLRDEPPMSKSPAELTPLERLFHEGDKATAKAKSLSAMPPPTSHTAQQPRLVSAPATPPAEEPPREKESMTRDYSTLSFSSKLERINHSVADLVKCSFDHLASLVYPPAPQANFTWETKSETQTKTEVLTCVQKITALIDTLTPSELELVLSHCVSKTMG